MFLFELRDIVGSAMNDDPVQSICKSGQRSNGEETNQQSLSLLCLATSSPLHFFSFGSLLGSS
jgi:hypothetical protein